METAEHREYRTEGRWWLYGCVLLLFTGFFTCAYAMFAHWSGDFWRCIYLVSGGIAFAFLSLIPLLLPFCVWLIICKSVTYKKWARFATVIFASILAFVIHLLLTADLFLMHFYGYHLNGLVVNLIMTPGGFESMGLDWHTELPGICIVLGLFALELALAWWCLASPKSARLAQKFARHSRVGWTMIAVSAACLLLSLGCCGVADFKAYTPVMEAMDTYPLLPNIRMRHFLRAIGLKESTRQEIALQNNQRHMSLNYPSNPIERKAHEKMNIVWLVGESLRADLLTPEIMPNTWRMASKGWRFQLHFSGGNGTRPAMFSMFYGLYANNWDAFLRTSRSPLILDWYREDGAKFLCQTSAKFSYPEFDRTIFSGVPSQDMKEFEDGEAWKRDIDNASSAADFIRQQNGDAPFFLFCFFESPHAPYSFPENEALRKDYLQSINYALVSEKDAARLYNRSVNAAHHLDIQLERIFKALDDCGVMEKTIVIVTGDHGEEFYEKGRLGHNSTFSKEQTHVPLVLIAPGMTPHVYDGLSHHTDIVPTIAPFLGVTNSADDYSVGGNLMTGDYHREYFVSCGWDTAVLATHTRKLMFSLGNRRLVLKQSVTTFEDVPVEEDFLKENGRFVKEAQQDMTRFVIKRKERAREGNR